MQIILNVFLDDSQVEKNQAWQSAKNREKTLSSFQNKNDDPWMEKSEEPKIPCEFCDELFPASEFNSHSVYF